MATRLHAAVLALCSGTPVLPVAYEFKTQEVFGQLGVPDWVQDIETVTGPSLTEAFERVLAELPDRLPGLLTAVAGLRDGTAVIGEAVRTLLADAGAPVAAS